MTNNGKRAYPGDGDEIDVYQGRARRRCSKCGLEIEIEKPTRVVAKTSTRAWRRKARKEVARQLLWEAMCEECRGFWNGVVRRIESGPEESRLEEAA
jgi:hypothetical protein